jgi:polyisoprenyl-phosphate glycosyltransferase
MASLDIVIPVFNEAAGLVAFHATLEAAAASVPCHARFIYVNDGSTDNTSAVLRHLACSNQRVTALELSRNFGHQAALTAGLEYADADMVIMMDGDGQHPAGLIPEMIRLHEAGYDIVQAQRIDGSETAWLKAITARGFYEVLNRIGELNVPLGAADFRLISRDVLYALRQMREYHRFLRGMISWLGFRTILLPYHPSPRQAGVPKYSVRKMLRLAGDGLFSFSLLPLRLGILLGLIFLALGGAELFYIARFWLSGRANQLVPGWSSIIVLMTLASGVTMILLGFIGIYVGMIFQEVKRRPVYILRRSAAQERSSRATA